MCGFQSQPYEVGRMYAVKCVRGYWYDFLRWWPVMGEAHRDEEIIGFKPLHFHIDWRFVESRLFEGQMRQPTPWFARNKGISNHQALHLIPLCLNDQKVDGRQTYLAPGNYKTEIRRMLCKREHPAIAEALNKAPWAGLLLEAHASACLKRGVCPHRGYDLAREPVVDGVVTCPLHGMRWNVETGRTVPPATTSSAVAA